MSELSITIPGVKLPLLWTCQCYDNLTLRPKILVLTSLKRQTLTDWDLSPNSYPLSVWQYHERPLGPSYSLKKRNVEGRPSRDRIILWLNCQFLRSSHRTHFVWTISIRQYVISTRTFVCVCVGTHLHLHLGPMTCTTTVTSHVPLTL